MAYATYITTALVCGSKAHLTSDRSYLLFTKDAGMLWATARSVREIQSKQRYAMQDFSFVRVSLIRGKSGWRIGSTEAHGNPFLAAASRRARGEVTQVVKLLRRFIHGEETQLAIYSDAETLLPLLVEGFENGENAVTVFTLRLLYNLGYVTVIPAYAELLQADARWLEAELIPVEAHCAIEQALQASHL